MVNTLKTNKQINKQQQLKKKKKLWEGSMVKKTLYKGLKLGIVKSNDTMELIAITEHSSLKSIYEKNVEIR